MTRKGMGFHGLVLVGILSLVLVAGCGGGGDGESQSQSIGSNEADVVFTGGDGYSPDSNLVIATFSDVATGQATGAAVQSSPAKLASGARDLAFPVGALSQSSRREVRWISQFTQSCNYYEDSSGNKSTYYKKGYSYQNGYCGFASVLMGADYLLTGSTKPAAPATVGYSTETGRWIEGSVANAFMDDRYSKCGGTAGISYSDIPKFVEALGLYGARQFDKTNVETENWIKTALINDQPVIALVPYQGNACSGRNNKVSQAVFYGAGSITQKMMPCPELTYRHWVLVAEIDPNSVLIYDPDPFAMSEEAGIRRYTKESFLDVLPDTRSGKSGKPNMYRLCSSENDCKYEPEAFSTLASIELGVNHSYTASNSAPVVNPLVPQYSFEGSDLPAGLFLETEGRLVGMTTETGTFHPTITMRSVVNGVERVAAKVVELTVKAASGVQDKLEFAVHSILSRSTVGINYFLPLGMTPTLEPVTFSVVSGNLPPGLSLWNGSLVGKSTQSGTYSFDIEAATSTTSTTKSFTLNIDPATDNADQVSLPYLQGVNPSPVPGKDGQQFVALKGSGFSDGIRVRLEDTTFGGTFMKVPVSINSAGTEITLSANFTSNSALWTATVIGPTGLESDAIQFSVVAPSVATTVRPSIWAPGWNPPIDGNLEVTVNYGAFSKGCSNADLNAVYAWYEDSGRKEHLGLDLRAPAGTIVRAIAPGKVLNSGKLWGEGWGDVVLVEHWTTRGETFTAAYGHINATVPQEIKAGTVIGTVYNLSSGPHLHFGIAQGSSTSVPGFSSFNNLSPGDCRSSPGETVNPENFLHTRLSTALSLDAVTTPTTPTDTWPGTASVPEPTTSTTVALSWSGVSGATYYDLGVRDMTTTQLVVNTTTSTPFYSVSLAAGKQYRWNVAACNSSGCSNYTSALYFKTPGATVIIPATPTSPSPGTSASPGSTTSGSTVALNWGASSGATYYELGVKDIASGLLVVDTQVSGTSYSANLSAGKQYRWNVAACNSAGCSSYTTPLYLQTPGVSPTVPAVPTGTSPGSASSPGPTTSGSTVALSWSASSGATYYELGVKDIASGLLVVDTQVSGTSYSANLSAGKQYRWNVAACNSAGCSSYTTQIYFQTPGALPTVPTVPTSASPGSTSSPGPTQSSGTVGLSWGGVLGAAYYSLGVRDIVANALVVDTTTTGTSYTAALTAGKQYRWNVAACNSAGCSSYTTVLYFQTPAAVVTPAISSLSSNSFNGTCSAQQLTIYGSNFVSGATVNLYDLTNGDSYLNKATTFNSSGQLTLSATYGGSAANWSLTVVNPNGLSSSSANFSVIGPTITGVFPSPVPRLNSAQTITFYGTGFLNGAAVQIDDGTGPYAKTPTVLSSGQMTISAYLTSAPATWRASIRNCPGLGDTWSPWFNF